MVLLNGIQVIDTGSSVTGPTGYTGSSVTEPTGYTGSSVTGPTGYTGSSVTGPTGPVGSSNNKLYGNGDDGSVIISSNTTLTRDVYYTDLGINTGVRLITGGYRIFCSGTINNLGAISNVGGAGSNGTTGGGIGAIAGILGGGSNGANGVATGAGLSGSTSTPTVFSDVLGVGGTGGKIGVSGGGSGGTCAPVVVSEEF